MKNIENESMRGLPEKAKPSNETFKVPEGFFEGFPDQIMKGESHSHANEAKSKVNAISIAAAFSVIALSAALIYQQTLKNDVDGELDPEDLAHYIILEGTSHEELALQIIPEENIRFLDEKQSDEIFETYLLEQEIDINHINEEL